MPAIGGTGDVNRAEGAPAADGGGDVAGAGERTVRRARLGGSLGASLRQHRRLWACGLLLVVVAGGAALAFPSIQFSYHFRAARAALQRYHNPEAIRHLQACLRLRPMDADALLLAARAARRARAYDEAQRALEKYHLEDGSVISSGSTTNLLAINPFLPANSAVQVQAFAPSSFKYGQLEFTTGSSGVAVDSRLFAPVSAGRSAFLFGSLAGARAG